MKITCEEWLRTQLKDWTLCDHVRSEAFKAGYTRAELKQARKRLGVETFHQFDEDGATPNWFWRIKTCEGQR